MADKIVKFKGTVKNRICNYDNFKAYGVVVNNEEYPNVKLTKYGNATINGDLPELIEGMEYDIVGVEQLSKYGYGYNVKNIKLSGQSDGDALLFLKSILTENQALTLHGVYPDIIQIIKEGRESEIDFTKLKGITEKNFVNIKEKILSFYCLMDLVNEFQGILSLSVVKKLYEQYTSIDIIRERLKSDPYECLCAIGGIGFKTADSILLELDGKSKQQIKNGEKPIIDFGFDLTTSVQRCSSALLYILQGNEDEGHTKMTLNALRTQCINLISKSAEDNFQAALKNEKIYYNPDTLEVALKKTYGSEKYVAERIVEGVKCNSNTWTIDTAKYKTVGNFELSDEQSLILDNICSNSISILNGSAGSGKSFSTKAIIDMLKDNRKTYCLLAPTGRASKVLAEYTNEPASTIHRGLGFMPPNIWNYNLGNKMPYDIIIVDEFSMVDLFLFEHLIDAIDFAKTKLLLIGDSAQIPSVGCGNLLHDFLESKTIPTVTLTKIFRYGEGGLMTVATDTRNSKCYLNSLNSNTAKKYGTNNDYMFIDTKPENIEISIISLYKKLIDCGGKPEDIMVLTAKNVGECGTISLNNKLQSVVNKNVSDNNYLKTTFNKVEIKFFVDDMVVMKKNTYKAEIYNEKTLLFDDKDSDTAFIANGDIGKIRIINREYMVVEFDGIPVKLYKDSLCNLRLAYAISIHSSQGGSAKTVILSTPKSHSFMLNSNLIYVGLTRTKEKCYHIGDLTTVNRSVKKKADLSRNTFMVELIKNF